MKKVWDIVNFNADASCLEAEQWLKWIDGGKQAPFYHWLQLYVDHEKPIILALTGATAADLFIRNPEAIALIKNTPDIFQIIERPFSHDAALLRLDSGYRVNLALGKSVLSKLFGQVFPAFLPPEFMLTAEQTLMLTKEGTKLTFVNASRLEKELQARIPQAPYMLTCPFGKTLSCLPIAPGLTQAYLQSLDNVSANAWNDALSTKEEETIICWRDGESSVFFPEGIERERAWLRGEKNVERQHLSHQQANINRDPPGASMITSYPLHSMVPWVREFKLLGYINQITELEKQVLDFDPIALNFWLFAISSDVLSAVEKASVPKKLRHIQDAAQTIKTTFYRTDRGFEGSACLSMLKQHLQTGDYSFLQAANEPWVEKLRIRLDALQRLHPFAKAGDLLRRQSDTNDLVS